MNVVELARVPFAVGSCWVTNNSIADWEFWRIPLLHRDWEFWRIPLHRDGTLRVIEAFNLDAKLLQQRNRSLAHALSFGLPS